MDSIPPGPSVHAISQARILEWVFISFLGDLPDSGIKPTPHALAGRIFTTEPLEKPVQFSCSVMSDSLQPHESQHTRLECAVMDREAWRAAIHGVAKSRT